MATTHEKALEINQETFEKLPQDLYGLPQYYSDFAGERHYWPKQLGGTDQPSEELEKTRLAHQKEWEENKERWAKEAQELEDQDLSDLFNSSFPSPKIC